MSKEFDTALIPWRTRILDHPWGWDSGRCWKEDNGKDIEKDTTISKYTASGNLWGTYWRKDTKRHWQSYFTYKRRDYSAGTFDTREEAHEASVRMKKTIMRMAEK